MIYMFTANWCVHGNCIFTENNSVCQEEHEIKYSYDGFIIPAQLNNSYITINTLIPNKIELSQNACFNINASVGNMTVKCDVTISPDMKLCITIKDIPPRIPVVIKNFVVGFISPQK